MVYGHNNGIANTAPDRRLRPYTNYMAQQMRSLRPHQSCAGAKSSGGVATGSDCTNSRDLLDTALETPPD